MGLSAQDSASAVHPQLLVSLCIDVVGESDVARHAAVVTHARLVTIFEVVVIALLISLVYNFMPLTHAITADSLKVCKLKYC